MRAIAESDMLVGRAVYAEAEPVIEDGLDAIAGRTIGHGDTANMWAAR
jgi:hypothetical protein